MKKFIIALLFIAGSFGHANAQTTQKASPKKSTAHVATTKTTTVTATEKPAHIVKKKEENVETKHIAASHTKSDGTADRRFKENKTKTSAVPLKKDGTPDKRYKANKG
mgnify:CR=1 FL=1